MRHPGIYESYGKLTAIWLKGEKSNRFYDDLFQYMLDSGIYGKDENGIWSKFSEKKMHDKDATPRQLKRWYYFPSLSYMSELYPWLAKHSYLLPVAWGIRAWRGVFMNKGVQKRKMFRQTELCINLLTKNLNGRKMKSIIAGMWIFTAATLKGLE